MSEISLVINLDNRQQRNEQTGLFDGVVNYDFFDEGIYNKQKLFSGFDIETIVFVDKHNEIPEQTMSYLHAHCDTVCIRRHTNEPSFNDYNYLSALSLARGEYIAHFDQDTNGFAPNKDFISSYIKALEKYKFVSYPSHWSPVAVDDPSFEGRTWASTRFFMCRRETLKFDTLLGCIKDPDWAYKTYGDNPRKCNWLEHFLTLTNENSCFYPPINYDEGMIFTWGRYDNWTLRRLNNQKYDEVKEWVLSKGGIVYPNDVYC